jgi:DHA1 family bicyclomycin/chloramphenicol resistance-like MFS transporter
MTAPRPPFEFSASFIVILVGLLAVQPISTDLYLPSLPSLARHFEATTATVTWTLSALVGTFGITQLFVGPVADRFGRRPVVLAGLGMYCAASVAAMLVPTIGALVLCRMLQGIGVACAFVVGRSLIRDLFEPQEGARVMARGFMWMSFVPLLGPVLGGLLDARLGWQAPFATLGLFSASLLLLCATRLPETNRHMNADATRLGPLVRNYRIVAVNRVFASYTAATASSYAGLFAFISGSSFVFIQVYGLSREAFGMAFGIVVAGYLAGTMLCRRWLQRAGIAQTLGRGGLISVASGTLMVLLVWLWPAQPLALLLPQFGFMLAHGVVQPAGQAGCIAPFPAMAGAASALNGFAQMLVAVCIGMWIGASFNHTPYPLVLTIFAASCAVALATLYISRTAAFKPA